MNKKDFDEIWKPVSNVIANTRMDYAEAVTIGGQFGELISEIKRLRKRVKELEYAAKYNGELNEFLQKRKLPPNTLGRHVVDVVIEFVEELERENRNLIEETGYLEQQVDELAEGLKTLEESE
ncbi:hypothetical protein [Virgibacillus kimchii]